MTREEAGKLAPILSAYSEGKTVQIRTSPGYRWVECDDPEFHLKPDHYRVKPEPKLRPWRSEEVPVGCLIRNKWRDSEHNRYVLLSLNGEHVSYGRAGTWESFDLLLENSEYSTDGGKTWKPCGVEE